MAQALTAGLGVVGLNDALFAGARFKARAGASRRARAEAREGHGSGRGAHGSTHGAAPGAARVKYYSVVQTVHLTYDPRPVTLKGRPQHRSRFSLIFSHCS